MKFLQQLKAKKVQKSLAASVMLGILVASVLVVPNNASANNYILGTNNGSSTVDYIGGFEYSKESIKGEPPYNEATIQSNAEITFSGRDWEGIYGGYAHVSDNSIDIGGGSVDSDGYLIMSQNIVNIIGKTKTNTIDGAYLTGNDKAGPQKYKISNNTINLTKGEISKIHGAYVEVKGIDESCIADNSVLISGSVVIETRVIGARGTDVYMKGNNVSITNWRSDYLRNLWVYGADVTHNKAENNFIVIKDCKNITSNTNGRFYGAFGNARATAVLCYNSASFTDSKFSTKKKAEFAGAYSVGSGEVSGNKINVVNTDIILTADAVANAKNIIYGGRSQSGTVKSNEVLIDNSTIIGDIIGGSVDTTNSDAKAAVVEDNIVNLGGKFDDAGKPVFLAQAKMNLKKANLYGYQIYSDDTGATSHAGNTLNVFCSNLEANSLQNFDNINFYIPKDVVNGGTMLTVTGTANISGSTVAAGVGLDSKLKIGDKVTLIDAGTLTPDDKTTYSEATLSNGLMKTTMTIKEEGNKVIATIGSIEGSGNASDSPVTEEAKSPVETQSANISMLNMGNDLVATAGFENAAGAIAAEVNQGALARVMTPYMATGGSKTRVNSGSHVDVKGWNLNIGFAKEVENKSGKLLFGPVVEYGRGKYDSYLDKGTHGEGNSKYLGAGVIAKQTNNSGIYYEGSLRAGKVSSDYKSSDLGGDYDYKATYIAAHAGVGKIHKISEKNSLDYYGKLFYTHQGGDKVHLGGTTYYDFENTQSIRSRLGARFTHNLNTKNSWYTGLAWQHEFKGESKATIYSMGSVASAPAPSVKGNTGIFELGWNTNASKNLTLGLGMTGSVGKQKGVGLNLNLDFKF